MARWLLAAAIACGPSHAAENAVRATQLMGWSVFDSGGQEIARLEDMVVDTAQNRLVSLLLSVGTREYRQVAMPAPVPGGRFKAPAGLVLEGSSREGVVALRDTDRDVLAAQPALRLASDLLRSALLDAGGAKIGSIEDLVVRLDAPGPVLVVVKFDPAFHKSDSLVAIPVTSFEVAPAKLVARFDKDLRLPPPKPVATAAPQAPPPPVLDPEARLTQILNAAVHDAAGAAIGSVKELGVDLAQREATHVLITGDAPAVYPLARLKVRAGGASPAFTLEGDRRDSAGSALPAERTAATRLLQAGITDSQGKPAGNVEDVVVNLKNGRLHFAVASFNPNWVAPGWLVAIPVRPLRKGEGDQLAMQFDLNELNRAYLFQKERWPDVNDAAFRALIERHLAAAQGGAAR